MSYVQDHCDKVFPSPVCLLPESDFHPIRSSPEYVKLHKLLDCHGYLKIYSIWGTKDIGQLSEQEELYAHIKELWDDFQMQKDSSKGRKKSSANIDRLHLKDALSIVRSEFVNFLNSSAQEFNMEFIYKVGYQLCGYQAFFN